MSTRVWRAWHALRGHHPEHVPNPLRAAGSRLPCYWHCPRCGRSKVCRLL